MSVNINALPLKNSSLSNYDGQKNSLMRVPEEVRFLYDQLVELDDLNAEDWKEIYQALLKRLTDLHDPWQVLAVIYRAIELRSDFITANRIIGKFLRYFYLLFEKLPGTPSYFIPSEAGRWLFESLINPFERPKVQAEAERQVAVVHQLSLISFLQSPPGGVRV